MTDVVPQVDRFAVDAETVGGAGWWMGQLETRLAAKRNRLDLLRRYSVGDSPLMDAADDEVKEAFGRFQKRARTNFAGLTTEVMLDRMHVAGIRTGADGDQLGDEAAWQDWQANSLDADSGVTHQTMLNLSESFVIVGAVNGDIEAPLVTAEDPRNIAIAVDRTRRRQVRVALNSFKDEWTGREHQYLYQRGEGGKPAIVWHAEKNGENWEWLGQPRNLPITDCPVVWFPNRLEIDGTTTWGEFEQHTDALDRITTITLQWLVTAAMQAFRQRMLKGLPKTDPDTGEAIDWAGLLAADPAAIWALPVGVEVFESAPTDFSPMLLAGRDSLKDYAAGTRTPIASLLPDAQNVAAGNSDLVESGHLAKVIDRTVVAGECWEQVVRLMFLWRGDTRRANRRDMEVLWAPPQLPGLGERFDAALKARQAGADEEWIQMYLLGMSPQQIRRQRLAKATQPPTPAPQPGN